LKPTLELAGHDYLAYLKNVTHWIHILCANPFGVCRFAIAPCEARLYWPQRRPCVFSIGFGNNVSFKSRPNCPANTLAIIAELLHEAGVTERRYSRGDDQCTRAFRRK